MKTLYTALKALACLFFVSFLTMPAFAVDTAPVDEEMMVSSTNPIMVIRCKRNLAFDGQNNKSKNNSKSEVDGQQIYTDGINGLTPNCNLDGFVTDYTSGRYFYFNSNTGMCVCAEESRVVSSEFVPCPEDFCWTEAYINTYCTDAPSSGEFSVVSEGCDFCPDNSAFDACDDIIFDVEIETFVGDGGTECEIVEKECFDGEVDFTLEGLDCSNLVPGALVEVTLCFQPAEGEDPFPADAAITIADISNCLDADGNAWLDEYAETSGTDYDYVFGELSNGEICGVFDIDPQEPIIIEFTNTSVELVIPTCFEDPCSCDNPDNITNNGAVELFADNLRSIGTLPEGAMVTITNTTDNVNGFTNASGIPFNAAGPITIGSDGLFSYPFYKASGAQTVLNIQINDNGSIVNQRFVSPSVCNSTDCPVIPTMGQWALLILGLILTSIGLVYIRRKAVVKS